MNKLLRSFLLSILLVGTAHAQLPATSGLKTMKSQVAAERPSGHVERPLFAPPASPLAIDVPGANQLPLRNYFHAHSSGRAMHNIQVDPSNPSRVHAVIMADVAGELTDTTTANFYPGRRVYYLFSSDAGATWSAPRSLSTTRAGYPDLRLYKRGDEYMPIISMHRTETGSTDWVSILLIGTGTPGSGEFNEVVTGREHSTAGQADLIWPAIALSPNHDKVYMIASLSPQAGGSRERFQFSTFDLNAMAGTATWSGSWKNGPGDDQISIEAGGQIAIETSQGGKVGVIWVPSVNNSENVHFSESTDGGNTWSDATIPVYERTEAMAQDQNGELTATNPTSWMTAVDGLDLMYVGEVANGVWSGHAQTEVNDDGSYTYYPSIGAIMHWKQGALPVSLISRREWSFDYEHKVLMEALAFFPIGIGTNPQGDVHLEHSTIARTGDPRKWSVIFNAWIEADTSESFLYDRGGEEFDQSFTYRSIWMITTTDGGQTWSDPEMIRGDDPESFDQPLLDFRFPQVSSWNPIVADQAFYQIMYTVDTLPGIWEIGGQPIWGNVSYFSERVPGPTGVSSVKRIGTTENLTLDQNYPNPFNPSTSVSFSVKETAQVRLVVEDMMGREVATLFEGIATPGQSQKVKFDASNLTSGVYQYLLKTENESVARRMVLTK